MAGTRAARRRATQTALITEARRRFAAEGYTAVRLSDVVEALGVTKGALYHHFTGKHDLFRAVVRQVQQEVGDRVAAAAQPCTTPWEELVAGCEAFLASHSDPEIRRIMLIDAPIVLGWQTWREMDEASSQRLLTGALTDLIEDGVITLQPVEPLAHLLSGAMNEAALWLAEAESPTALEDTMAALHQLLGSLRSVRSDGTALVAERATVEDMSDQLPSPDNVILKGIREDPDADDGTRVLVDRLWPRGVSKERADLDEWAKDATPTTELRRAFHHGDLPWPQFVDAYRAELTERPEAVATVEHLRSEALKGRVTLLFAGHDHVHSHARVLREAVLGIEEDLR